MASSKKHNREICLEVDMDDSVKDIIKSMSAFSSTLLDVTVIKPSSTTDPNNYITETNTMNCSQVRKLIASMEMGSQDKTKLLDKIFRKKSHDTILKISKHQGNSLKHPLTRTSSELCMSSTKPQVYTTVRSYKELQNVFSCKNKTEDAKPEFPCYCKNCAMMGVITDTQKRPLFAGPIEASGFEEKRSRKASDHVICNLQYTKLTERINELEERLSMQEERSVAKDYFKRIITKLVSHITKITSSTNNRGQSANKRYPQEKSYTNTERRYHVNPLLIHDMTDSSLKSSTSSGGVKTTRDTNTQSETFEDQGLWKWGNEIIRPGMDLKNKIVQLMDDYLKSVRRKRSQDENSINDEKEIKIYVDVISDNLYHENLSNVHSEMTSISTSYKRGKEVFNKYHQHYQRKIAKEVNVAYVNPRIARWKESSVVLDDQLEACREKFNTILQNTKIDGKKKLWNTIWNQALANGQKKSDRVTIQIPNSNHGMYEIYYTIAELETMLNTPRNFYQECCIGCKK